MQRQGQWPVQLHKYFAEQQKAVRGLPYSENSRITALFALTALRGKAGIPNSHIMSSNYPVSNGLGSTSHLVSLVLHKLLIQKQNTKYKEAKQAVTITLTSSRDNRLSGNSC